MTSNKKPLHPHEQSMLLTAMLFDRKNLHDILQFFPNLQSERMNVAKKKFLELPRNERMTQIILELRRLLLIDEHRIDWIHQSWIEDSLKMEPLYLRPIIKKAIANKLNKQAASSLSKRSAMYLTLICNNFIAQLTKSPQKRAIYDPVLMRLQALKNEAQDEIFSRIGSSCIDALAHVVNKKRLFIYLQKKNLKTPSKMYEGANPFVKKQFKKHFIKELIYFKPNKNISCEVFAGVITVALYLAHHKSQWQRTIVLSLHIELGKLIEKHISRAQGLAPDSEFLSLISVLLLKSIDQAKNEHSNYVTLPCDQHQGVCP